MKILGYAVVDKDGNTGVGRITHFLPHPDSVEVRDLDALRFAPHRLEELVAKSRVDEYKRLLREVVAYVPKTAMYDAGFTVHQIVDAALGDISEQVKE